MLRYDRQTTPGLVALYDIRLGNGAGPFLQPRSPHGACRCGPTSPGLCLAASLYYASCAAFVGLCRQPYYSRWSSRWCCHVWTMATPRLPIYQETSSIDCIGDECLSTACLLCTKVRPHNAATPRPSLVAGA